VQDDLNDSSSYDVRCDLGMITFIITLNDCSFVEGLFIIRSYGYTLITVSIITLKDNASLHHQTPQ